MPTKINRNAAKRYDALLALLCGRAFVHYGSLDFSAWGAECGISESTLRRRINAPEEITLGELRALALPLGIPEDTIRAAVPV